MKRAQRTGSLAFPFLLIALLVALGGCKPQETTSVTAKPSVAGRYVLELRDQNLNHVPQGSNEVLTLKDDNTYQRDEWSYPNTQADAAELQKGNYEIKGMSIVLTPATYRTYKNVNLKQYFIDQGMDAQTADVMVSDGFEKIEVKINGSKLEDQRRVMAGPDGVSRQRVWVKQ